MSSLEMFVPGVLSSQGKLKHKISHSDIRRRWYATGPPPSLSVPPGFASVLDPARKVASNRKLLFSMSKSQLLFQQSFFALEASSFISWHLGSLRAFLQYAVNILEQGDIENALLKFKDMFKLMSSLDCATDDSLSFLVPSVSAWILRMKEHYLAFTNPNLSNLSKSRGFYDKLNFNSLFSPEIIKSFQDEIKLSGTSKLNRKLSQAIRPFSQKPSTSTFMGSSVHPPVFRGKGSRPFRGSRARRMGRGQTRPFKKEA